MSDHLRRFRDYMAAESRFLSAAADRARVLDHKGNRGFDAEHAVVRWLKDRVEPEYTVSSGEVVDSFQTSVDQASRQHDAIIHQNTRFARRFSLASGLRLVPIETVALVTEIKLDVDAEKFREADEAATKTAQLRLAVDEVETMAAFGGPLVDRYVAGPDDGVATTDERLRGRIHFALFAFGGPKQPETLALWLRQAKTISLICCLDTGCAYRPPSTRGPTSFGSWTNLTFAPGALTHFGQIVAGALSQFEANAQRFRASTGRYAEYAAVNYWDATGFIPPDGYHPGQEEIDELVRLGHLPTGWKFGDPLPST